MMQLEQNARKIDAPPGRNAGGERMRHCIVTRENLDADCMIRFVVADDGTVVPDIAGKLPGRGLWLGAHRDILDRACTGRFFAQAARAKVGVTDDLTDRVESLLSRRCLELIGLARRAGEAVAGFEKVRALLRSGGAGLLLGAADGATGGRAKMRALAGELPVVETFSGAELGAAFGRDSAVHAAVAKGALAGRLITETVRLAGIRVPLESKVNR